MRPTREILSDLYGTGLSPDQMALVAELSAAVAADASGGQSKHAKAQARYRQRLKVDGDHVITSDHRDHALSPPAYTTPPVQKPKRVSVSIDASEIPNRATDEAATFAGRQGWENSKIDLEWQRFRDHSLSKGRKHRDILAAWRNWVRSPYQANGNPHERRNSGPAADRSASAAAGRLLEKIRSFDAPLDQN